MHGLAAAERFEEAADVRDRAAALAAALRRQRRFDTLRRAGRVVLEVDGRSGAELLHGRLVRAWRINPDGPTPAPLAQKQVASQHTGRPPGRLCLLIGGRCDEWC